MTIKNSLGVPAFNLCSSCVHRGSCRSASGRVTTCEKPEHVGAKESLSWAIFYQRDDAVYAEQLAAIEAAKARVCEHLRRVTPEMIRFKILGGMEFVIKPKAERDKNSRKGFCKKVPGSKFDYQKFCDNCGAAFTTVNESRLLCDECWEEICGVLNIDYYQINQALKGLRK